MNTESIRALHELTNDCPLESVQVIHGSAGDNAADTIGHANRHDANGQKTDDYLEHWIGSVQDLLSSCEATEEARAWFAAHGISY